MHHGQHTKTSGAPATTPMLVSAMTDDEVCGGGEKFPHLLLHPAKKVPQPIVAYDKRKPNRLIDFLFPGSGLQELLPQ